MEKESKKIWSSFDTFDRGLENEDIYQAIFEGLCNIELNGTIVVLKHSLFWNRREFSISIQGSDAQNLFLRALDDQEWSIEDGNLVGRLFHHDGTNRYIFRIFQGDVDDCFEALDEIDWDGDSDDIETKILSMTDSAAGIIESVL